MDYNYKLYLNELNKVNILIQKEGVGIMTEVRRLTALYEYFPIAIVSFSDNLGRSDIEICRISVL